MKGQNLRLLIQQGTGSTATFKCFAAAKSCVIRKQANTEESTTKDTTSDDTEFESVSKSWTCSANGLVTIDTSDTTGEQAFDIMDLVGTKVQIKFTPTTGTKNRQVEASKPNLTGYAIITSCEMTADDRANATYSVELQGTGALTKGTNPTTGNT